MTHPLFSTPILMNAVDSGNIARIGYDAEICVLEVEFKGGARYRYKDVPAWLHLEFAEHRSPGSFLHQHIKGKYECFKYEEAVARAEDQIGE